MTRIIKCSVFGVFYEAKEWKLRNSAVLAEEDPREEELEPVAE
jgi:hypothetical protein